MKKTEKRKKLSATSFKTLMQVKSRWYCPKCGCKEHPTMHHLGPQCSYGYFGLVVLICESCHRQLEKRVVAREGGKKRGTLALQVYIETFIEFVGHRKFRTIKLEPPKVEKRRGKKRKPKTKRKRGVRVRPVGYVVALKITKKHRRKHRH